MEPPEGEEGSSEASEASYPLRCSFTVTKVCNFRTLHAVASFEICCYRTQPSVPGALSIDAVCQEGAFVVENVSFYNDSKLATDLTAEADWKRRGLYIGPQVCLLAPRRRHRNVALNELCTSSRRSTSAFRMSLRSSSRSEVSTRISHSSSLSTRSTKSKRYLVIFFRFRALIAWCVIRNTLTGWVTSRTSSTPKRLVPCFLTPTASKLRIR